MRNIVMEDVDFERRSRELGLDKLAADHKSDLRKALENGAALVSKIPPELHWTDEPTQTFNLPQGSEVKHD